MYIFNSLTKKKELFTPTNNIVGMYHCGPTVYDYVHIGNLRSFLLGDLTRRALEYAGYETLQVMNITDVGHLVSDGDEGDDKMTKALKREDKEINLSNMLEVANFYAEAFKDDLSTLNMLTPHHLPKASDHIKEDIDIIKRLEQQSFTYITNDGVYFDTSKMPNYGILGGTTKEEEAEARIHSNTQKRQAADFALWKFDEHHGWTSPWGQGFPGWHIECSGMSMKYLGEQFDIHTGGSDLQSIHHNNEIAQSESSSGNSPFVRYWMHGGMLNFGGSKLSKSTGGNITLQSLKQKNINPLSYRYLALQTHYRSPMNFTWEILTSAESGLQRIYNRIIELKESKLSVVNNEFQQRFKEKIEDDINTPQALAVFHDLLKSDLPNGEILATAYNMDLILGLDLASQKKESLEIPQNISELLNERKQAREEKNWSRSDELRNKLHSLGYTVTDVKGAQELSIHKKTD